MSSILTNTSAMVALQTMRGINANMASTQSEISTGKSIATAKDNASIWAISKVMESDVAGFNTISSNLSLGESTVSVARTASETITDLLVDIKGKIVDSQQPNKDRGKIQTDISALTDQIKSVISAAQFNGLNLVDGKLDDLNNNGDAGIDVLASLDRKSDGSVTANHISVDAVNLSTDAGVKLTDEAAGVYDNKSASLNAGDSTTTTFSDVGAAGDVISFDLGDGNTAEYTIGATPPASTDALVTAMAADTTFTTAIEDAGYTFSSSGSDVTLTANEDGAAVATVTHGGTNDGSTAVNSTVNDIQSGETITIGANAASGQSDFKFQTATGTTDGDEAISATAEKADLSEGGGILAGDVFKLSVGDVSASYTVKEGDTQESIIGALHSGLVANGLDETKYEVSFADNSAGANDQTLSIKNKTNEDINYSFEVTRGSGALAGLDDIDVTSAEGAKDALGKIEGMIDAAIQASADFGSAQGRLETQQSFVSKLTDSLKAGIGALVDADMEETSARLQSLQVQQQLGVQALSIANQQPQSLLSLFR